MNISITKSIGKVLSFVCLLYPTIIFYPIGIGYASTNNQSGQSCEPKTEFSKHLGTLVGEDVARKYIKQGWLDEKTFVEAIYQQLTGKSITLQANENNGESSSSQRGNSAKETAEEARRFMAEWDNTADNDVIREFEDKFKKRSGVEEIDGTGIHYRVLDHNNGISKKFLEKCRALKSSLTTVYAKKTNYVNAQYVCFQREEVTRLSKCNLSVASDPGIEFDEEKLKIGRFNYTELMGNYFYEDEVFDGWKILLKHLRTTEGLKKRVVEVFIPPSLAYRDSNSKLAGKVIWLLVTQIDHR